MKRSIYLMFIMLFVCSGCSSLESSMVNDCQQYQINNMQESQWQTQFNQNYYNNVQEPANNWYKNAYGQ